MKFSLSKYRYMWDSDNASDIPSSAGIAAGYVDGSGTYPTLVKIRPKAKHLSISIHGAKAKCYDMENGALSIPDGVTCAKRDIAAGDLWPWLYFSTSNYETVKAYCQKAGIWGKCILFGAHYDLTDAQALALIKSGQGYYAVQNVAPGYGATGHWDRSVLAPYIPGFDPKPIPVAKSIPAHVRVCDLVVRRYLDKYAKTGTNPFYAVGETRFDRLSASAKAAVKHSKGLRK